VLLYIHNYYFSSHNKHEEKLNEYVLGIWIKTYIFERTWNEILKMQILAGYMIVLVLGKHGVIGHCGGTKFTRFMFLSYMFPYQLA
jgi:hypothetical protein